MLKALMEKANNMENQINNFTRMLKTMRKNLMKIQKNQKCRSRDNECYQWAHQQTWHSWRKNQEISKPENRSKEIIKLKHKENAQTAETNPAETAFKSEGEESFLDKQTIKLRKFTTSRPTLKEMLNLQAEDI